MNKRIISILCTLVLVVASGSASNATSVLSEEIENQALMSEEITIAVGGTVYNEEGTVYGLSIGDGGYLENLEPLDEKVMDKKNSNETNFNVKYTDISEFESKSTTIYEYTPTQKSFAIKWSEISKSSGNTLRLDVVNAKTGDVVARAYNIKPNVQYISAYNFKNMPLEFKVVSDIAEKSEIVLSVASIENVNAKEYGSITDLFDVTSKSLLGTTTTYTTSTVPKNINGNQGQVLFMHTVTGSSGHRRVNTKHSSSTNGQLSVNVALEYAGIQQGYVMCLNTGDTFSLAQSFPVGAGIDFRMSTNSTNQGQATMKITDTIVW